MNGSSSNLNQLSKYIFRNYPKKWDKYKEYVQNDQYIKALNVAIKEGHRDVEQQLRQITDQNKKTERRERDQRRHDKIEKVFEQARQESLVSHYGDQLVSLLEQIDHKLDVLNNKQPDKFQRHTRRRRRRKTRSK